LIITLKSPFGILSTIEDDLDLIRNELRLAEKYPDNTTIVHMDKNGNYKVVYVTHFESSLSHLLLS
jgi:hypothetical protein